VSNYNAKVSNAKLAIWLFLSSDFLFFGAFISAFVLYRGKNIAINQGVEDAPKLLHEVLDIPFTSVTSFVLLMSSLTMVLALSAIKRGDAFKMKLWLAATVLFGTIFIGGQIFEFTSFVREGFRLDTNLSSSSFFILTGLHGAHVTIGIVWLLVLLNMAFIGDFTKADAEKVEIAGLYWHFVDVVWIVIFTLVYLIPIDAK
jgi:heme/copper-type cytochrome/quinol oxidase subunit 3